MSIAKISINNLKDKSMKDKSFWMYQIHLTQVVLWHATIFTHVKHKTLKDLMSKSNSIFSAILRLMTNPLTEEYITETSAQISDSLYDLSFLDNDLLEKASEEFAAVIEKYQTIQKTRTDDIQAGQI